MTMTQTIRWLLCVQLFAARDTVLTDMEEDTELFEILLCSYPSRFRAVRNANGRYTDYRLYSSNNDKINYYETYLVRTLVYKLI